MNFQNFNKKNLKTDEESKEINQNEASMNRNQPLTKVSTSEFMYSDDETFDNDSDNIGELNTNPSVRFENELNVPGTLSEDLIENLNNTLLISDDDDDSEYSNPTKRPKFNQFKDLENSSNKFNSFGCRNHSNCHRKNKNKHRDIISKIIRIINFLILYFSFKSNEFKRKIIKWILNFTETDTFYSAFTKIPSIIIEKLFCWCNSNSCRKTETKGIFTLPLGKSKDCDNEDIITKCSWPGYLIGILILLIFVFGSYNSNNDATWVDKYYKGIKIMKKFYHGFLIDLENTAGMECVRRNNCCSTKLSFLMRWIKCILLQPYYVATISQTKPQIKKKNIMKLDYNDIKDWKLKRQLKRISMILQGLQNKLNLITKKSVLHTKNMNEFEKLLYKNLSKIDFLEVKNDLISDDFGEIIKDFENFKSNIISIEKIRDTFLKIFNEIKSCSECSSKNLINDIESIENDNKMNNNQYGEKIKFLKSKIDSKYKDNLFEKETEILKAEMLVFNDKNINFQISLTNLEGLSYQIHNDINAMERFSTDRLENHMTEIKQINRKLIDQFQKNLIIMNNKLKTFKKENENLNKQFTIGKFNDWHDIIKEKLLKIFCKNLGDQVKLTIQNSLTMNVIRVKTCSIFYVRTEEQQFTTVNIRTFKEIPKHNCCINENLLQKKISDAINKQIDGFDYALTSNGARIIEDSYVDKFMFHDNYLGTAKYLLKPNIVYNHCWLLKSIPSQVTIQLNYKINVTNIAINHIAKELTFKNSNIDAPKDFEVYILSNIYDLYPKLLGTFTYQINGNMLQTFKLKKPRVTKFIRLRIINNYGDKHKTCVYKFKVYGNVASQ